MTTIEMGPRWPREGKVTQRRCLLTLHPRVRYNGDTTRVCARVCVSVCACVWGVRVAVSIRHRDGWGEKVAGKG